MRSVQAMHSSSTTATRDADSCAEFLVPFSSVHWVPKPRFGLPDRTLGGSFWKKGVTGTRPEKLLSEMLSTTRFCITAMVWRSPLR
ncbi:hypothetical protein IC582_029712 [Cucumis melo]